MTRRILRGVALGLGLAAVGLTVRPSLQARAGAGLAGSASVETGRPNPEPHAGMAPRASVARPIAPVVTGQKIARLRPDASPFAVAAALGLTVEAADPSQSSALFSGEGRQLEALDEHREVLGTWANGRTFAAASRTRSGPEVGAARAWHHAAANVQGPIDGLSEIIVAVLDSGVAYRTTCGAMACAAGEPPTHRQVEALAEVPIVAPMDFVDGDAEPFDEHQHGTHIAATIVGRATPSGVAAGASLMPVRVLDAAGQGTEYALACGIHHAIEHGADLINLSLTFQPGFVPSPVLWAALDAADAAGVPIFASTGNEGLGVVSWPAASPKVVAVAASSPEADHRRIHDPWQASGIAHVAAYSNTSAAVDLVAPGGDLTVDRTGDGHPDGILAETIALGNPSETGLWWFEGTSHAAALATGAAARLLALGAAPETVVWALQGPARPLRGEGPQDGVGGGYLDVAGSEDAVSTRRAYLSPRPDVQIELEPYLERSEHHRVRPAVALRVVESAHLPGTSLQLHATLSDGTEAWSLRCATRRETDACTVRGHWTVPDASAPRTWTVQIDGVHDASGVIARPTVASDGVSDRGAEVPTEGRIEDAPDDAGVVWGETDAKSPTVVISTAAAAAGDDGLPMEPAAGIGLRTPVQRTRLQSARAGDGWPVSRTGTR